MNELVRGAYDLHVHPAPDVQVRKASDQEIAQRIINAGMAGYALKSHYFCTAGRAKIISDLFPGCDAVGAITLNDSVGGLNPVAVELAARAGARIVWMPTVDCEYERQFLFGGDSKNVIMPYWAKMWKDIEDNGVLCPGIGLRDGDGRLKKEVLEILDIVKRQDICLATSHISHEDTFALARAANDMHYDKLLISHVLYPSTTYTFDELTQLLRLGATFEYSYSTFTTKKTTYEKTLNGIKAIGPSHCIISSDLGMPNGDYPDEGLVNLSVMLYNDGISEDDIHTMNRENPKRLIGRA